MYGDFFVTIELNSDRTELLPNFFESLYEARWSLFVPDSDKIACYANRLDADPDTEVSSIEELMRFSQQNETFSILLWSEEGTDLTLKVSRVKNITRFIFYWHQLGADSDKLTARSLEAEFLTCCFDNEARGLISGQSNQTFWEYEDIEAWLSSASFARTSPKPTLVILNGQFVSRNQIASLKQVRSSGDLRFWGIETNWNKPMDRSGEASAS